MLMHLFHICQLNAFISSNISTEFFVLCSIFASTAAAAVAYSIAIKLCWMKKHVPYSSTVRYSVCMILQLLRWIAETKYCVYIINASNFLVDCMKHWKERAASQIITKIDLLSLCRFAQYSMQQTWNREQRNTMNLLLSHESYLYVEYI